MVAVYAGQFGPDEFIDRRGNAIPRAEVSVYLIGTATLATLYADRDRVTPLANPLPTGVPGGTAGLDAEANATFWVDPGRYTVTARVDGIQRYSGSVTVENDPAEPGTPDAVVSVNGRTGAVVGLAEQSALASEAATRGNADTAEATARATADTSLSTAIASEATTRAAADTAESAARLTFQNTTAPGTYAALNDVGITPTAYGADPTGVAVSTAEVLAAIVASVAQDRPFTPIRGTYLMNAVDTLIVLPAGERWVLDGMAGAKFKVADGSMNSDGDRLFKLSPTGPGAVERVDIRNVAFDGNRRGNVPPGDFDWEHNAILALGGNYDTAPITQVTLANVEFYDPVADCVWINDFGIDILQIMGMLVRGRAGTRSDITFSAFPRLAQITGFIGSKIEAEITAIPGTVTHDFLVQIANSICSEIMDLGGGNRATFEIDNAHTADFSLVESGGHMQGGSITFPLNAANQRRVRWPTNFTFENVDIYLTADASGVVVPLTVNPQAATNHQLRFKGCRFHLVPHASLPSGPFTGAAIKFTARTDLATTVANYVEGCEFDPRFEMSVWGDRCGHLELKGNDYGGTAQAVTLTQSASVPTEFIVDGGVWDRVTGNFAAVVGAVGGNIQWRNIQVPVARGVFTNTGTLSTCPITSNRILNVTSAPTGGGFRGDRARLISPSAGVTAEYLCVVAHASAATWIEVGSAFSPLVVGGIDLSRSAENFNCYRITPAARIMVDAEASFIPFIVSQSGTVASVRLRTSIAASGGSGTRSKIGIWASASNNKPTGAAIHDFGAIDLTVTAGVLTLSLVSPTLTPGIYWLGVTAFGYSTQATVFSQHLDDWQFVGGPNNVITPASGYKQTISGSAALPTIGTLAVAAAATCFPAVQVVPT